MKEFIDSFYSLTCEMAPYLLLGFLIAGILHAFVPSRIYTRYLAQNNFKSVITAALFGVPLPLCSCGVIPTAASMRQAGASKASTVSFLISTPQTGVDSIAATYSLLGLPFAIIRPVTAFLTGIFGGLFTGWLDPADRSRKKEEQGVCKISVSGFGEKIKETLRYGFVDMVQDIGKNLLIGLIIAAVIAITVPDDFFELYASHRILNMFLVLLVAIPMYVCATGSIPIAAALMLKGLSPGAALVFLMAGPAVNMASVMVIRKVLGKKSLVIYIATIVVGALIAGLIVDYLLPERWFMINGSEFGASCHHHHHMEIPLWKTISVIILGGLLVYSLFDRYVHKKTHHTMGLTFKVKGMTCNHCKANVEKAISHVDGVEHIIVDLSSGTATVEGNADAEKIIAAVEEAGYDCQLKS